MKLNLGFELVHGSGNLETREFEVQDFRQVRLSGIGNLSVNQTGMESLRIEAEDNFFDYLRVEVRDATLHIGVENNVTLRPTRSLNYFLTVKDIEGIAITGSGNVVASDLQSEQMKIEITGSGDFEAGNVVTKQGFNARITGNGRMEMPSVLSNEAEFTVTGSGKVRIDTLHSERVHVGITGSGDFRLQGIETKLIETHISGSGDIELYGKTVEQELKISAAGKYKALDLESENARIKISGSGSARVSVSGRLDARISGSGSIYYQGRPIVVQSISGAGKVKHVEA